MLLVTVIERFGFFWNSDINCNILDDDEQQITCYIKQNELQRQFITTFAYA